MSRKVGGAGARASIRSAPNVVGTRRANAMPKGLTDRYLQVCLRRRPSATVRAGIRPAEPSSRPVRRAPVPGTLDVCAGVPGRAMGMEATRGTADRTTMQRRRMRGYLVRL